MLVRAGMGIDNVIRRFEPLIGHTVPQRAAVPLHRRDDFLAAPRGDATDDVAGRCVTQDLLAQCCIVVHIARRVTLHRNKGNVVVRGRVDKGHTGQHARAACFGDQGIVARPRIKHANFDTPFACLIQRSTVPNKKSPDAIPMRGRMQGLIANRLCAVM